jgi:hypothetical protein
MRKRYIRIGACIAVGTLLVCVPTAALPLLQWYGAGPNGKVENWGWAITVMILPFATFVACHAILKTALFRQFKILTRLRFAILGMSLMQFSFVVWYFGRGA